jgi:TIR domain-containing protein
MESLAMTRTLWDAFLSAAPADRQWAAALHRGLTARGLLVGRGFGAASREPLPEPWREGLRSAIRDAAVVVVLVGREHRPTEAQRFERQAVLEAVWADPRKRLVPVLLRNAVLPPFLRSLCPVGEPIPVYRLKISRIAWAAAVAELTELAAIVAGRADLRTVGELIDTSEEDRILRRERLADIRQFAESLPG